MHNRQFTQASEYDAEFYMKVAASFLIVCFTATAVFYINRNFSRARFFPPKPSDSVTQLSLDEPSSVPYKVIDAKLDTGDTDAEEKPLPKLNSETPTTPTPLTEVAAVDTADQKEKEASDAEDDFVDLAGEDVGTPTTKPQEQVEEPARSSSPRLR